MYYSGILIIGEPTFNNTVCPGWELNSWVEQYYRSNEPNRLIPNFLPNRWRMHSSFQVNMKHFPGYITY